MARITVSNIGDDFFKCTVTLTMSGLTEEELSHVVNALDVLGWELSREADRLRLGFQPDAR